MQMSLLNSIREAIVSLNKMQSPDGSFLSLSSTAVDDFSDSNSFHSTFPTSLILLTLGEQEKSRLVKLIQQKCVQFLLSQKSDYWSFNYWVRNSPQSRLWSYPDDLDDTFCALSALFKYDHKLIDGSVMAKIVQILTAVEDQEGGPYRTWIVPEGAEVVWKDVDLAVNSNVGYFLRLHDIELPNLKSFITKKITDDDFTSPYYYSAFPVIYFICRFLQNNSLNSHIEKVKKFLISKRDSRGIWQNSLDTALAVTSLINLGFNPKNLEESIKFLLSTQRGGGWNPYPFIVEQVNKKEIFCSGSPSLTTAFCLEAINKYFIASSRINRRPLTVKSRSDEKKISKQIVNQIKKRFSFFDQNLYTESLNIIDQILKIDKKVSIVLLPYYFRQALGENGKRLEDQLLVKLGMANLYGWIAYTIYDHFLDDEGNSKSLSVANIALRELTLIFSQILPNKNDFSFLFKQVLDKIDEANNWEVNHCRFKINSNKVNLDQLVLPDYGKMDRLAQKSLGIGLGPLALLCALGYKADSDEVSNITEFFHHLIIAKQLNDDAHDWKKDLKLGYINPVGALLLNRAELKGIYSISKLVNTLQSLFWHDVIEVVCEMIFDHIKQAREAIKNCQMIVDRSFFETLLNKYERVARLALKERDNTLKFLSTYQIIPT